MKIAFIVSEFPSISETFILNQITGLIDRGNHVEIFANRPKQISKTHPDIYEYKLLERTHYFRELPKRAKRLRGTLACLAVLVRKPSIFIETLKAMVLSGGAVSFGMLFKISPFLASGPFDLIICHFGPNGNLGCLLKKAGFKGKVVTFFHGYDMSNYFRLFGRNSYRYLFSNGDLFMPISENWKKELLKMNCNKRKILVHRMGVDTNKFSFRPRTVNGKQISLLTVARLVEKKGVRYGIEAVSKIIHKHKNLVYRIVGDGPLKEELQQLIRELNAQGRIQLLGWKNQAGVIKLMKESHLMLAPSITAKNGGKEGIPVVLMEAMAQGIPVLSTYHSGIPELIEDGKSGLLVPERDVNALAQKLDYLLSNPQIWPSMSEEGRARIKEQFDIHLLNDRLVNVFQELALN